MSDQQQEPLNFKAEVEKLQKISDKFFQKMQQDQRQYFDEVAKVDANIQLASIEYSSALLMNYCEFLRIWADSIYKGQNKYAIKAKVLAFIGKLFDDAFEDYQPHKVQDAAKEI